MTSVTSAKPAALVTRGGSFIREPSVRRIGTTPGDILRDILRPRRHACHDERVTRVGIALAVVAAAIGWRFGTFTAGGSDSYGYVSQADLWLKGSLIIDQPLHDEFSWRWANWTLSPLGYKPGNTGGTMVPTYAPGLPLQMAAFKALAGGRAVFFVVPLLGALAVWLTFVLGRQLGDGYVAALSAFALLASPAFLSQLVWPMSDVPAMAWWLAAIVTAAGASTLYAGVSGLAAAAAILTRPNLVPLAVLVLGLVVTQPGPTRVRVARGAAFTAAMLPGPIAVALINNHLYGSPILSGYGSIETLYAGQHFVTNIVRYPTWLVQTQTPFILLAAAAPFVSGRFGHANGRRLSVFAVAFFVAVLLLHVWYTPYDHWTYLRFLLPAYPIVLTAAASAFGALVPAAPRKRMMAFAAVALLLGVSGGWYGRGAFLVRATEARYPAAARFAEALPDDAIFLCNQHSGSLRYYANRLTLRFEWLEPDVFVAALDQLRASGRPLFVVLDDSERDVFRARYSAVADLSWLDRPATLVAADSVYFYQLWPAQR